MRRLNWTKFSAFEAKIKQYRCQMCFSPDDPLLNVFKVSVYKLLFSRRLALNCEVEQNTDSFHSKSFAIP